VFERRLRWLLGGFAVASLAIVTRLVQLQVVQGAYYQRRAAQALVLEPRQLPTVRGRILDRNGEVLVRDEPSWNVNVDYPALAAAANPSDEVIERALARWRRRYAGIPPEDRVPALRAELAETWLRISHLAGGRIGVTELEDRAREVYERIQRIRRAVAARRGFDSPVAEETQAHPVLFDLSGEEQIAAREVLGDFPWAVVEASAARRIVGAAEPLAHVLGRLGPVDAESVERDPNADDPFARYLAGERLGISGVEHLAERRLRGRRGQLTEDREGQLVGEIIEAQPGDDVVLTLHADLQRRLFDLLGEVVQAVPESAGGAIVVLEVARREVLALVSYPSYDPARFDELYAALRDDTERLPLRFRAVSNTYAPGSTVKPLTCLAGLINGAIDLQTRVNCTGYLLPEQRERWRCWEVHGTDVRMAHGPLAVVDALIGSCNVFMYTVGERLGVDRLCSAFDMVGVGRSTGIGLKEEATGVNPTPSFLASVRDTPVYPAHARLFAIGQGELLMTPVQVANLMATYGSGVFRPVTLLRDGGESPAWTLPGRPEHWQALREGICGVVNDPAGTAYSYARLDDEQFKLCGKTGSATAPRWPTAFRVVYLDEEGEERSELLPAGSRGEAMERFTSAHPGATFDSAGVSVTRHWPPGPPAEGDRYSHAWFAGYLQPIAGRGHSNADLPPVAFAVLVEFGGSGGRTAGPLARRVARELIDVLQLKVQDGRDASGTARAWPDEANN